MNLTEEELDCILNWHSLCQGKVCLSCFVRENCRIAVKKLRMSMAKKVRRSLSV